MVQKVDVALCAGRFFLALFSCRGHVIIVRSFTNLVAMMRLLISRVQEKTRKVCFGSWNAVMRSSRP